MPQCIHRKYMEKAFYREILETVLSESLSSLKREQTVPCLKEHINTINIITLTHKYYH